MKTHGNGTKLCLGGSGKTAWVSDIWLSERQWVGDGRTKRKVKDISIRGNNKCKDPEMRKNIFFEELKTVQYGWNTECESWSSEVIRNEIMKKYVSPAKGFGFYQKSNRDPLKDF